MSTEYEYQQLEKRFQKAMRKVEKLENEMRQSEFAQSCKVRSIPCRHGYMDSRSCPKCSGRVRRMQA
jgi:hypothetical protein